MQVRDRRWVLGGVVALALTACAPSKFRRYDGPEVTRIEIHKGRRKMYLLHHKTVLKEHRVGLGANPVGHKQYEGDSRTPEGVYYIDRKNPNSNFHLSLGISYPNAEDRARAAAMGKSPGGDIFIHGRAGKHTLRNRGRDWTDGCIAVTDREMEDVYAMVRIGTPVYIYP
jgi:murein L,D-transpeptidase YafK